MQPIGKQRWVTTPITKPQLSSKIAKVGLECNELKYNSHEMCNLKCAQIARRSP